jgi:hypothetical protein
MMEMEIQEGVLDRDQIQDEVPRWKFQDGDQSKCISARWKSEEAFIITKLLNNP